MKCERCKDSDVKYAGSNLCEDCYLSSVDLGNSSRRGIQKCHPNPKGKGLHTIPSKENIS